MPVTVDWPTKVISVPQSYLTLIDNTTSIPLYQLDADQLWKDLAELEASQEGIDSDVIFARNADYIISGVSYAQAIAIINDYTITFEDGQYGVNIIGANNNILDITNRNNVSVAPNNSAGLTNPDFLVTLQQDIDDLRMWIMAMNFGSE